MAVQEQYRCDVCEKPKGHTNHWFYVQVTRQAIVFYRWDDNVTREDKHFCGQECATIFLQTWMAMREQPSIEEVVEAELAER